jgi:AcrR family transcriptional regulator
MTRSRQHSPTSADAVGAPAHAPGSPRSTRGSARGSARARLLTTARTLFLTEGIRATGVDRVIAESAIAKATLYHHFATKEELVVAALEAQLADWHASVRLVDEAALAEGAGPTERVARLFEQLAGTVTDGVFRGCPFSNALTELPASQPVREVAERYRTTLLAHIARIVDAGPDDTTVRTIVLLLEGATNVTKTTGTTDEILLARDLAVTLAGVAR